MLAVWEAWHDKHGPHNIKIIQMNLTSICQKKKTYNAILSTNGLTVTVEPLLKIWSLLKNNFLIWQIIKWDKGE